MIEYLSQKGAELMWDESHAALWDVLIAEERGYTIRTHVFLLTEALFALGYGLVAALAPAHAAFFTILGLSVSLVWLAIQYKTMRDLERLSERLKALAVVRHYLAWREECRQFLISHEVVALVVPALCLVGWFVALAFTF